MDAMPKPSRIKKLSAKLKLLFDGMSNVEVAAQIGVSAQQVSQYLSGSVPGPEVLFAIARTFNVPIEWLLDDAQPAKLPVTYANVMTDNQLLQAFFDRLKRNVLRFHELLDQAEKLDWEGESKRIESAPVGEPPRSGELAIRLLHSLYTARRWSVMAFVTYTQDEYVKAKGLGDFKGPVDTSMKHACIVTPISARLDKISKRLGENEPVKSLRWALRVFDFDWIDPERAYAQAEEAIAAYKAEASSHNK